MCAHVIVHVSRTENIFMCMCAQLRVHMWRSEDNSLKPVLSFHTVCPGDRTGVLSLSTKCLYPLSKSRWPLLFSVFSFYSRNNHILGCQSLDSPAGDVVTNHCQVLGQQTCRLMVLDVLSIKYRLRILLPSFGGLRLRSTKGISLSCTDGCILVSLHAVFPL